MSQMVTIKLAKADKSVPWGFRLQGGKDFATPLCIQKVNLASVAEQAGMQAGDAIVSIAGQDALTLRHKEAQDSIIKSGNTFELVVQRGGQPWKPAVTALADLKPTPDGPVATSTSLAAPKLNGQKIVNAQYNTPLNLYSEDNIAETLSAQAEVLGKAGGCLGINFKKFEREVKLRTDSPTYLLLHGENLEEPKKPRQLPPQEAQASQPAFPARPVGQFGGGDKGYYNINEKLYCDVHAKQASRHQAPGPNMEPVTVNPGAAPPAGAMSAQQVKVAAAPAPAPVPEPQPVVIQAPVVPEPVAEPVVEAAPRPPVVEAQPEPVPVHHPAPAPAPAPAPVVAPPPVQAPVQVAAAPAPAPAPFRMAPAPAPMPMNIGLAPAGDVNVRSHVPKKGTHTGAVPAPKPAAAVLGGLPKPSPPPGGVPVKGLALPGQRTAPKRGRGVMNQSSAARIPVCSTCQRQIRGPFVSALGKTWCPDHFICATDNCRKPLIDMGFVEEKGALYCEVCYEQFLAPVCGKCDKRIKGDCLNAVGKQFHPECFCCAYCGKVFGSGAFYLEDGLPYCEADWNDLFTTKCAGCGFPIEAGDRWVEALNNNYHSQCFKCSKCNKNLEGQSFFAKGGKPFCKAHAARF